MIPEYSFVIESDTTIYNNVRLAKFKFLDDGDYYLDNISIEEVPLNLYFAMVILRQTFPIGHRQ